MVEALNATIRIFRVQKYLVNGSIEYLSPERTKTIFETTIEEVKDFQGNHISAIELLGGGEHLNSVGKMSLFKLNNGDRVSTKYSRYYENDNNYWFGVSPGTLEKYNQYLLTHVVFILGNEGVVKIPLEILNEYLSKTHVTNNPDGTVRHYHVNIKGSPDPRLYISKNKKEWSLEECYHDF